MNCSRRQRRLDTPGFMNLSLIIASALFMVASQPDPSRRELSVLFIGNSLTYANDLPGLVKKIAFEKGVVLRADMVAYANYALEDHWKDGEIQRLIAAEKYHFVIAQQGPSSQEDGRRMLIEYSQRLSKLCARHGCELALFMVWPARSNHHAFEQVSTNYRDAATSAGALLCPVGEKWKAYMESTGDYSYYARDGFHPTLKGSRAAAEVIVEVIIE
jgi:lysophospholipase L1-like esterase